MENCTLKNQIEWWYFSANLSELERKKKECEGNVSIYIRIVFTVFFVISHSCVGGSEVRDTLITGKMILVSFYDISFSKLFF